MTRPGVHAISANANLGAVAVKLSSVSRPHQSRLPVQRAQSKSPPPGGVNTQESS